MGHPNRVAYVLAVLIAGIHVALSWAQFPVFWGDSGRWLHEIDRYAHGEEVYRDFFWAFPPLAMWTIGGLARLIGSELAQVLSLIALLTVAIAVAWVRYAAPFMGDGWTVLGVLLILPLGIVFSTTGSAPLASGMYTPAAPVGFLCLLLQLLAAARLAILATNRSAVALGLFGALAILSKHDFWIPAAVLTVGAPSLAGSATRRVYLVSWTVFVAALAAAIGYLVSVNGWAILPGILTGFGHVQEFGSRSSPTIETLTLEALVAAALVSFVALTARAWRAGVISAAIALSLAAIWFSQADGVFVLRDRMLMHVVPALIPAAALVLLVLRAKPTHWRLAALVLVAALALRVRRGLEFTEWSSLLLELPIYLYLSRTLLTDRWKLAVRPFAAATVLLIGWQHYDQGYGPFTRRGIKEAVRTPRGAVRMGANSARYYRTLKALADSLDPSGSRPVFAFGYSGAFNYFLNRPAASPLTHGFRMSTITPDSAVARLRAVDLLAIDQPLFMEFRVPARGIYLTRWHWTWVENHYRRFDRAYFDAVIAGCRPVTNAVYDCVRNGS